MHWFFFRILKLFFITGFLLQYLGNWYRTKGPLVNFTIFNTSNKNKAGDINSPWNLLVNIRNVSLNIRNVPFNINNSPIDIDFYFFQVMECASPQDLLSNPQSFFNAMIASQTVKTPSPWEFMAITKETQLQKMNLWTCAAFAVRAQLFKANDVVS